VARVRCSYPLTGMACVSRVYTDQAVFDLPGDGRVLLRESFGESAEFFSELLGIAVIG
jgi:3-oxoadipate CoA-transferase, beta subunit